MKSLNYKTHSLVIILIFFISSLGYAQVRIGTNATINSSSILEMESNDKGLLIPRMSEAQRIAIDTPATGLMVYQTNLTSGFYFYNGTVWEIMHSDTSKIYKIKRHLYVSGKVSGVSQTKTTIVDNAIGEQFSANAELYFEVSKLTDYAGGDLSIKMDFIAMGAETGRTVRWNLIYKLHAEGTTVSGTTGTIDSGDLALNAVQYKEQDTTFTIPAIALVGINGIHFKIKRVAIGTGTNPVSNPAVLHLSVSYNATR